MFDILTTRYRQGFRTMSYPDGPAPALPARHAGRPVISATAATCAGCPAPCAAACPTAALSLSPQAGQGPAIDTGRCLFCRECERACPQGMIRFTSEHRLASTDRADLVVRAGSPAFAPARHELAAKLFSRSFKLRQVSAGGCNACEADSNVLGTLAWDMGRFGIQFVASPRHADGLLITGPVTENMRLALEKTHAATPSPKVVIAVGSCAVSGGPYAGHAEQHDGASAIVPVDLFIPGCPPHPLTILDGLLRFLGIVKPGA